MNKSQKNNRMFDDQLASFTDDMLNEKTAQVDEASFAPDSELRALEQTALRLKNAFRDDGPSEEVIQRMRKNIAAQWQQQENRQRKPFWKKWIPASQKWQPQRKRQRLSMVITFAVLAVLMVLTIPLLNGTNLEQPAASGHNLSVGLLVASGGLILLAIWVIRSKR